jgi:tRNA threonylcarbamoyladenosine biosynthesis protein TsaE
MDSVKPEDTEILGQKLGQNLKGGEVIELVSDLGGGKTTFTRGLALGMGSEDTVASPTFTIRREYKADKLTMYHFDFYRISEPGGVAYDLHEVIKKPKNVVVVEWGNVVKGVLLTKKLTVNIKTVDQNTRKIKLNAPASLKYLLEGLK